MKCLVLLLGLLSTGCTINHNASSYRDRYVRDVFMVDAPLRVVVDRTATQARACLDGEHITTMTGGARTHNKTEVQLRWLTPSQAELLVPAAGKSTTYGMTMGSWSTFSVIADFTSAGSQTQVQPYARGKQMAKAIRRWAQGESPACPNYEL